MTTHNERLSHLTPVAILEDNGERDWPIVWRGALIDALKRQSIHNHGTVEVAKSLTHHGFYEGDGFSIYLADAL